MFKDDSCLYCERCKKKCPASKRTRIIQAPQTLIVTLKRFEYDTTIENIRKIDRQIDYKEELSLPLQVSEVAVKLELFAVIVVFIKQCQAGSIFSGHYYALIKTAEGKWICCNDEKISTVDSPVDKNAYILFYKKTNITMTQSEMFAPVKMTENPSVIFTQDIEAQVQVPEGEAIVCSRDFMDEQQFSRGLRVERAPTTFVKSKTRVEGHKY